MYKLNEDIIVEDVEEGKCLINEVDEKIILLKKVETKVFEYILKYPVEEAKKLIMEEYEGINISEDIEIFITELVDRKIFVWV